MTSAATSWTAAQAEAVSRGGNLVSITSAAEEATIRQQFGTLETFWIGLSDTKTEGTFQWVTGETLAYTNWSPGEPNNYGGDEDFVGMNFNGGTQWNDWGGAFQFRGIIELPITNAAGEIGLGASVLTVNEAGGTVTATIERRNGSAGTVTVDYATTPGTATAGLDYVTASGRVTFLPGETVKTVTITILNDTLVEGNETFGFAIDNVQGGATLLAPRTATVTITDDDSGLPNLFNYSTFASSVDLALNGNATLNAGALQLTPATNNLRGSAFYKRPIAVDANTSFNAAFAFRITGGTSGREGMTFTLQNAAAGATALGTGGSQLGYGGLSKSLAIEFDTYQGTGDANNNHVSILSNGNTTATLQTAAAPVDLNGGSTVYAWVEYDGATNRLNVFVSGTSTKPATALLSQVVDLPAFVGNQLYAGFTAATGGANNVHSVLSWSFASNSRLLLPPTPVNVSSETVYSGFVQPTAMEFSLDGRNVYVAEQRGIVRVARDGVLQTTPFLDFRDRINGTRDRGLLDIAVHPNFPATPYLYLIYTYDPPEVYQNAGDALAGPDKNGNRAGRITRVTADAATNFTTVVANSEVVLVGKNSTWNNFNAFANSTTNFTEPPAGIVNGVNVNDFIATDSESHTVGALEFGPGGVLYASIGDGTSYNRMDPRTVRVQDVNNLSGKVLRIDPITGNGLPDNPFWNGDATANRSKVYQLGVRNAFRMGVDHVTGKLYLGDVGWTTWEEINTGPAGANFGWPYYEGASGTSARTGGYQDLPEAQAFYAAGTPVTASLYALNHATDGINAIVMGDVYRGSAYPSQFQGNLFFNDLGQGIVRTVKLTSAGAVESVSTFTTGAQYVVQMKLGTDGLMYYVDLDNGTVGRWRVS